MKDYPLLDKPKPPPPTIPQTNPNDEWTIVAKKGKGKVNLGDKALLSINFQQKMVLQSSHSTTLRNQLVPPTITS